MGLWYLVDSFPKASRALQSFPGSMSSGMYVLKVLRQRTSIAKRLIRRMFVVGTLRRSCHACSQASFSLRMVAEQALYVASVVRKNMQAAGNFHVSCANLRCKATCCFSFRLAVTGIWTGIWSLQKRHCRHVQTLNLCADSFTTTWQASSS